MIREEIIRNLEYTMEKHKNDTVHTFETNISAMCKDILDYLKQELCEDAVSRQAVKSALCELCGDKRSCPFRNEDCDDLNAIDALPTVTPKEKTRWIPVSERLPEDKTYVLTTIKVPKRIAHARSGWYDGGFFMNDNGDTWRATDKEVIAWMPLPEPFEPQESEDKE